MSARAPNMYHYLSLGRTAHALFYIFFQGTSAHAHCLLTKNGVKFERSDDLRSEFLQGFTADFGLMRSIQN